MGASRPSSGRRLGWVLVWILSWSGAAGGDSLRADEPTGPTGATEAADLPPAEYFGQRLVPFLTAHCVGCHGGKDPEADLALDALASFDQARGKYELWQEVAEMLEAEGMPPADEPQPAAGERATQARWIREHLAVVDCQGPRDPGRVTIRRLNRLEYRHTIRDLVGVDYQPADDFPADDVAAGFDNIADALTLAPVLMERYLSAAEAIARAAIVTPENVAPQSQRFALAEWPMSDGAGGTEGSWLGFFSPGQASRGLELSRGRYRLVVHGAGDQAGNEPPRLLVLWNGSEVARLTVPTTRENPQEYAAEFSLPGGAGELGLAFDNDFFDPDLPEPTPRDRNLWLEWLELTGPLDAAPSELPESHRRLVGDTLAGSDDPAELERRLSRLATRAFRRPATAEEVSRLARLVALVREQGESPARGMQLALEAVLVSPQFLFRIELDEPPTGADSASDQVPTETDAAVSTNGSLPPLAVRELNEFELATRLSYFLWSSMPDDELLALAEAGRLRAELGGQVARLLDDPRARALAENFAVQWLTLRNLDKVAPDLDRYPTWDDELRQAMRQEAVEFFAGLVREDKSLGELVSADYTYANERLARHYGLVGVVGPEFRRVPLADGNRGGVLTMAGVLTVTSNPNRTSPVKRGKWVLEQLLGAPPPPPPPNVPELKEDPRALIGLSVRQRLEEHRANPSCAACHAKMDPLGFGLENFNGIGAWRDKEGGREIDASGELPDGSRFRGPAELRRVLAARQDALVRNLAAQLLTYALGRSLADSDQCVLDELVARVRNDGYRTRELILGIAESDPFQKRRLPTPEPEESR